MANKFFTADNHFFHKRIQAICPNTRRGDSLEEMHELMIDRWNNTVGKYDTVEMLGDFSFGKAEATLNILQRLNGVKHLIKGNHDHWITNVTQSHFASINDYKEYKYDGQFIVLCHYPIAEWNKCHRGSYHLHGHTHGSYQAEGRILDVGIDNRISNDMDLWEWSEIVDYMAERPITTHHSKFTTL